MRKYKRRDFKFCYYWEKLKIIQTTGIPGVQGAFSDKVTPDIDVFTDELVVQYDVQVVKILL